MKTVYFDLETGGLAVGDPVIQFAGIAVDETWAELEALELKIAVDPKQCSPKALEINHYSAERWKDAISEAAAVSAIAAFLARHADIPMTGRNPPYRPYSLARIGGHNVAGFDCERLAHLFKRRGVFLPMRFNGGLDTLHGATWYFEQRPHLPKPASFKQTDLAQYFGLDIAGAHDALVDVRLSIALARIFAGESTEELAARIADTARENSHMLDNPEYGGSVEDIIKDAALEVLRAVPAR